jgi:hypothetical protein
MLQLVIASACDHFTRVSMGASPLSKDAPVYGLLFGYTTSAPNQASGESEVTTVSINDSTDAIYEVDAQNMAVIVAEKCQQKIQLWTAVFTEYRLIGWYAFGNGGATEQHVKFHKNIATIMAGQTVKSDPVFLLMRDSTGNGSNGESETLAPLQLPMHVLQLTAVGGSEIFESLPFRLQTTPVEQVAVDEIIKSAPSSAETSAYEVKTQSLLSSYKILQLKTDAIIDHVDKMDRGEIPFDRDLARKAAKIYQLLSVPQPPTSSSDSSSSSSDPPNQALLVAYLSAATKTMKSMTEVADLYTLVYADDRNH